MIGATPSAVIEIHHGLYAVSNGPRADLLPACEAALAGGAQMLQYRDKTPDALRRAHECRALAALCARYGVPLIVNDDVALANAVGASGVHLGEDDADVGSARSALGAAAIIGVSCHDDLDRARALAAQGADYLAFGAFFSSSTKPTARRATPELLRRARGLNLPRVAIGGITPDNGGALIDAGADLLAVVSALFDAPDVGAAARRFAELFPASPLLDQA